MKNYVKYVITAQPENPGSKYWNSDGRKAGLQFAAEFSSFSEAKEFADEHGIPIDDVMNAIVAKP